MEIIKCDNTVKRKGIERKCGRFMMKIMDDNSIHVKCSQCDHYAIITVKNGNLMVMHVDKEGEEILCQKKI
jgi:hypothetical protein